MTGSTAQEADCQVSRVAGEAGLQHHLIGEAALIDVLGLAGGDRLIDGAILGPIGRLVDRPHHGVALLALGRFVHRPLHRVDLFTQRGLGHGPGDRVSVLADGRLPDGLVACHLLLLAHVFVLDAIGRHLVLLADGLIFEAIGLACAWHSDSCANAGAAAASKSDTPNIRRTRAFMVNPLMRKVCRRPTAATSTIGYRSQANSPNESARFLRNGKWSAGQSAQIDPQV